MKTWTLSDAQQDLADVARLALSHHPQRIELGNQDAVVLVNAADYAMLTFAKDLVDFVRRNSPAADLPGRPADSVVVRVGHDDRPMGDA
jgi:hypothetical protein